MQTKRTSQRIRWLIPGILVTVVITVLFGLALTLLEPTDRSKSKVTITAPMKDYCGTEYPATFSLVIGKTTERELVDRLGPPASRYQLGERSEYFYRPSHHFADAPQNVHCVFDFDKDGLLTAISMTSIYR